METITGLLYSQIGYDLGNPMRVIVRSTDPAYLPKDSTFTVLDQDGKPVVNGTVTAWGVLWKSSWWIADFSALSQPGLFTLEIQGGGRRICATDPFKVGKMLLWSETTPAVGIGQFTARMQTARHGIGWMDCGATLREANSHAAALIGLEDYLHVGVLWLSQEDQRKLSDLIVHGCDYLALCQDRGEEVGLGEGGMVHELTDQLIPLRSDHLQSVVAWARAARLLWEIYPEKSRSYLRRAVKAYHWLLINGPQSNAVGFHPYPHGAPAGYVPPREWMTRDLLMLAWGAVELVKAGRPEYKEDALAYARQVIARQVPASQPEGTFYGHFYTFDDHHFTEKAWVHHHVGHDTGAIFPYYVVPLIEMCRMWDEHPDRPAWRKSIDDLVYGYLIPACSQNPFYLLPAGYFTDQGLLGFGGQWHGINASYAFGASLMLQIEMLTGERKLRQLATGNLQWIAGLNAGITRSALKGALMFRAEIQPGAAEPYSMICGIGRQSAGSWTGIPGSICNGFDIDEQFNFNTPPTQEADGPWMFTDEDWIPHGGGWLSALANLHMMDYFFSAPTPD